MSEISSSPLGTPVRILLVDDSAIIRRVLSGILERHTDMKVVYQAENGKQAVDFIRSGEPVDFVVLDVEMPEMDGLTALPLMLKERSNLKVMIFSTLSRPNAAISMEALKRGAVDCMTKPSAKDSSQMHEFEHEIIAKIRGICAATHTRAEAPKPAPVFASPPPPTVSAAVAQTTPALEEKAPAPQAVAAPIEIYGGEFPPYAVKVLAIGSSTGGPQALHDVFAGLRGKHIPWPILITQHMPPTFTAVLAEQLQAASGLPCHEAKAGMVPQAGEVYIAPGDYHMVLVEKDGKVVIDTPKTAPVNHCRPSVDVMLDSIVPIYGKNILFVMLTGMGQDGLHAATRLVQAGATCVAQDKETCVVWGMPRAVTEAGICRKTLPLKEIAPYILEISAGRR